jgi:hypothetical protein
MSAPLHLLVLSVACACLSPGGALAADGLLPPAQGSLWPSLSARITIQTAAVSPLSLTGLSEPGQGLRGGALLGDYVFAQPSFGSFRATGGMVLGAHGGAPSFVAGGPADGWQAAPYLGLGFSSPLGDSRFSLSADLGWVAETTGLGMRPNSAPLGMQGSESQRRELRLSPLLQFGMRYTF